MHDLIILLDHFTCSFGPLSCYPFIDIISFLSKESFTCHHLQKHECLVEPHKSLKFCQKRSILTYNIRHGAPDSSAVVDLPHIAKIIQQSGTQVVALQDKNPCTSSKLLVWKYTFGPQQSKSTRTSGGHCAMEPLGQRSCNIG